jgi:hypothetical protein
MLKVAPHVSEDCGPYRNATSVRNPNPIRPGGPTGAQLIAECNAWLGPNQPGINQPDLTAGPAGARGAETAQRAAGDANLVENAVNGALQSRPPASPAPSAPAQGIDLPRTLQQLLGSLPGIPQIQAPALPGQGGQTPDSRSAQALLDFLLAP